MINHLNCPVCKSTEFTEVLKCKDYTVSGEVFGIAHCRVCEHRFTNPVPDQQAIGPYYKSQDYVSHTNTSKGLINGLYQRVRKHTLRRKRKLLVASTNLKKGKLLDVGSGAGAFLATMKAAGWDCLGLEPDADARSVAKSDFGVETKESGELFDLPANQYDAITMWHVLEHVHELDRYMIQLKELLKDNGVLFIAVPNYTSLDGQVYGAAWAAYDVPRHLYHFCPASLRALVERYGLELQTTRRMPFDSFYVSMLTQRNLGRGMLGGVWVGFRSWWVTIWNRERCSSLIYIIKKKAR